MGRRKKPRFVERIPEAVFFKPQGVPMSRLQGVVVMVEGLEAMRLVDAEGLSQEDAAIRMNVSRPTLCRILGQARQIVARALSEGMAIRIEGGEYESIGCSEDPGGNEENASVTPCQGRRGQRGRGMGRGRK